MNVTRLAQSLRSGGWTHHAARLGDRIIAHGGLPFERRARGRTLRIRMGLDGQLLAEMDAGQNRPVLIATEDACLHRIQEVPVPPRASRQDPVRTVRFDQEMLDAVEYAAMQQGITRSEFIRDAIRAHLRDLAELSSDA